VFCKTVGEQFRERETHSIYIIDDSPSRVILSI
jgi:hypothetical protein